MGWCRGEEENELKPLFSAKAEDPLDPSSRKGYKYQPRPNLSR
jgi:hypothetical protein